MKDAIIVGALLALYLTASSTEPRPSTDAIRGEASWYCGHGSPCTVGYGPSDLVAAIDPTTGIDKGERVRVTSGSRSVVVTIVDVCACPGERIVDLTSGAFARLAPLSRGVIPVSVTRLGPAIPLPETSTEDAP
jgi:rare lipoprotein A (peptidoglycan hydrolase)